MCSTAFPFLLSKGWNFGGSYPLGYGLPRSSGKNGGSRENCLGIPESFSLSCSKRALTSASIRYRGLAPPLIADPLSGWALSWLTTGGTLSLISWVLPSLRRQFLVVNLSAFLPFESQGLALVLRAFVPIRPLILLEVPCSSVWRPFHFLLRAQSTFAIPWSWSHAL